MFGTYKTEDVTLLLKNITGLVEPMSTQEREKRIQSGTHYSEMLPIEYAPSALYMKTYEDALGRYAQMTADAVAEVAEKIWQEKGKDAVLVSLARAGISIGVLIKRYLRNRYGADVHHYAISIIRGRGIDHNAMQYILDRHAPASVQFVDGWTGKGAIQRELDKAMLDYPGVSSGLAVLSDPACLAEKYGTRSDFLIVSSCLNCTVSGLLSRTFYRTDVIGDDEFHGAVFYEELSDEDRTYEFIETVERCFATVKPTSAETETGMTAAEEVRRICEEFGIRDINLVKPSIGEATRVLLRRLPWKILVHSMNDEEHLGHIYQLAKEKNVPLIEYPLKNYRACGLIQSMADN
ncbi:MAG: cysteine protease StiP family protein [Oscillospiraceae bacterium]|nr:cysteine protease StiP family protein [Oscillospiraceae bacterium]